MNTDKRNIENKRLLFRYFEALEKEVPEPEIDQRWNELSMRLEHEKTGKGKKIRILLTRVACVAALFTGVVWFSLQKVSQSESYGLETAIARLEQHSTDTSSQVVLVTHSEKQIEVEKGATVAYSKDGSVTVNQKKVEEFPEKDIQFNQLIVPKGKYSKLLLADGSFLYVNAGTKVVYPNQFDGNKREIYVDGEVFVDVARNEKKPFIIKTSRFDVKVLGTAFNINAYKYMEEAEVVLLRGSVAVTDQNNEEIRISPNELLDLSDGVAVDKRIVNAYDYVAWTKGRLPLAGKNVKIVLQKLSLFYGCEVVYDPSLEKFPLHGTIDLSVPLEKILERISKMLPIVYQQTDDGYYLSVK